MNPHLLMILWLVVYFGMIIFLDLKYLLLRDESKFKKEAPYSLARVQLAWWTGIVLSAFVAVVFNKNNPLLDIPTFSNGILVVLGISSATLAAGSLIDVSDMSNNPLNRLQDSKSEGLFLDIVSDKDGVSIHRLQAVLFNLIFAIWFFLKVWKNLDIFHDSYIHNLGTLVSGNEYPYDLKQVFDSILPEIDANALVLLGLSSGTYAALKVSENKTAKPVG